MWTLLEHCLTGVHQPTLNYHFTGGIVLGNTQYVNASSLICNTQNHELLHHWGDNIWFAYSSHVGVWDCFELRVLLNSVYCWILCIVEFCVLLNSVCCWILCIVEFSVLLNSVYCWILCIVEFSVWNCSILCIVEFCDPLNFVYHWIQCSLEFSVWNCWILCIVESSALLNSVYCSILCAVEISVLLNSGFYWILTGFIVTLYVCYLWIMSIHGRGRFLRRCE